MQTKAWINPYVSLIDSKPEYVIPCTDGFLSSDEHAYLSERIASAERLVLEPCSGSGSHILALAEANPRTLHIGFERRYKRSYRTGEKAEQQGLNNVIVVRTDAESVSSCIEEACVDGVYINFPDPWHKRRWEKHRLMTEAYVATIVSRLKPGGFFSYKTDHKDRFNETVTFFKNHPELEVTQQSADLYNSQFIENNVPTEFEHLFHSKRMPIFYLFAEKR